MYAHLNIIANGTVVFDSTHNACSEPAHISSPSVQSIILALTVLIISLQPFYVLSNIGPSPQPCDQLLIRTSASYSHILTGSLVLV